MAGGERNPDFRRIVVLSLLGLYVDSGFVGAGLLHRYSGLPVFVLGFATLGAVIWLLQRSEAWFSSATPR